MLGFAANSGISPRYPRQGVSGLRGQAFKLPRFRGDNDSLKEVELNSRHPSEEKIELAEAMPGRVGPAASKSKPGSQGSLSREREDALEISFHKHPRKTEPNAHGEKATQGNTTPSDSDEPVDEPVKVDAPPQDQYVHYETEQKLQKQLEWGKTFEPAGRAKDWVEGQMKWASRRAAVMASHVSETASVVAHKAMIKARHTAADQLKRLADKLEGEDQPVAAQHTHEGNAAQPSSPKPKADNWEAQT